MGVQPDGTNVVMKVEGPFTAWNPKTHELATESGRVIVLDPSEMEQSSFLKDRTRKQLNEFANKNFAQKKAIRKPVVVAPAQPVEKVPPVPSPPMELRSPPTIYP